MLFSDQLAWDLIKREDTHGRNSFRAIMDDEYFVKKELLERTKLYLQHRTGHPRVHLYAVKPDIDYGLGGLRAVLKGKFLLVCRVYQGTLFLYNLEHRKSWVIQVGQPICSFCLTETMFAFTTSDAFFATHDAQSHLRDISTRVSHPITGVNQEFAIDLYSMTKYDLADSAEQCYAGMSGHYSKIAFITSNGVAVYGSSKSEHAFEYHSDVEKPSALYATEHIWAIYSSPTQLKVHQMSWSLDFGPDWVEDIAAGDFRNIDRVTHSGRKDSFQINRIVSFNPAPEAKFHRTPESQEWKGKFYTPAVQVILPDQQPQSLILRRNNGLTHMIQPKAMENPKFRVKDTLLNNSYHVIQKTHRISDAPDFDWTTLSIFTFDEPTTVHPDLTRQAARQAAEEGQAGPSRLLWVACFFRSVTDLSRCRLLRRYGFCEVGRMTELVLG